MCSTEKQWKLEGFKPRAGGTDPKNKTKQKKKPQNLNEDGRKEAVLEWEMQGED